MSDELEEALLLDKLVSGDRPSVYTLGMVGTHSLKASGLFVAQVDVLGRVHVLPPSAVQILTPARVSEEELDEMAEDDAIRTLAAQGEDEARIVSYLQEREDRNGA